MTICITRRIEFDAGHRVPDHASKCANPHGHRYVVEIEVAGQVAQTQGDPENGMVADYGRLKDLLVEHVHNRWDHAFMVYRHDDKLRWFLEGEGYKVDSMACVPTAENLADVIAGYLLTPVSQLAEGHRLERVTVWETPNCSATWRHP